MEIAIVFFVHHGTEIILQPERTDFLSSIHLSKVYGAKQPWACVITLTAHSGLSFSGPSRLIGCGHPLAQGSCLIRYVLCCTCPHLFCPPPVLSGKQRVSSTCTHACKATSPQSVLFFFLDYKEIHGWWHWVQPKAVQLIKIIIFGFMTELNLTNCVIVNLC